MPKVDMVATKDFTYMTRRLVAGDPFQSRNALEAKILSRVRKVADVGRPVRAPRPVADAPAAKQVTKKAPAKRKAKAKK